MKSSITNQLLLGGVSHSDKWVGVFCELDGIIVAAGSQEGAQNWCALQNRVLSTQASM
jgi:hypothetical protein